MEPTCANLPIPDLSKLGEQFASHIIINKREEIAAEASKKLFEFEKNYLNDKQSLILLALEIIINFSTNFTLSQLLSLRSCSKELNYFSTKRIVPIFNSKGNLGLDHHYFKRLKSMFKEYAESIYLLNLKDIQHYKKSQKIEDCFKLFTHLRFLHLPQEMKLKNLSFLSYLGELKGLEYTNKEIPDFNVLPIAHLTNLENLFLNPFAKIKEGWGNLALLTNLENLGLPYLPKQQSNLDFLKPLTALKSLQIGTHDKWEDITPFASLTLLSNLTYLSLMAVNDARLKPYIEQLPKLQKLDAYGMLESCPNFYENLYSIKELNFSYCSINEGILQSLTGLTKLESLKINNFEEEIFDLYVLNRLGSLTEVNISCMYAPYSSENPLFEALTNLQRLSLSLKSLKDAPLQKISSLTTLQFLDLDGNQELTDLSLATLSVMTQLTALNLQNCKGMTEEGFLQLTNLKALKELQLSRCEVSDKIASLIGSLTQLEILRLADTKAELADLLGIGQLTHLKILDANHLYANREQMARLSHFVNLEELNLGSLRYYDDSQTLGDQDLSFLSDLTKLTYLNLSYNQFGNRSVEFLTGLTELKVLELDYSKISNRGLRKISHLKNLNHLSISLTKVSGEGAIKSLLGLRHLTYLDIMSTGIKKMYLKPLFKRHGDKIMIL